MEKPRGARLLHQRLVLYQRVALYLASVLVLRLKRLLLLKDNAKQEKAFSSYLRKRRQKRGQILLHLFDRIRKCCTGKEFCVTIGQPR